MENPKDSDIKWKNIMFSENGLKNFKSFLRRRVFLGLYLIHTPEGLVIQGIVPIAPAAKTGLQPGDRLETVNGNFISDIPAFFTWQQSLRDGEEVRLQAVRYGQKITVSFHPTSVPLEEASKGNTNEYRDFSVDGVHLRSIFTYALNGVAKKDYSLPGILIIPGIGGMPCDQSSPVNLVHDIAQTLAQHGALVMRYDQRGVGDSQGEFYTEIDFLTEVADAKKALKVMSEHPRCNSKDARIIGLSLGGVIASLIAEENKDVKRVCMWGSSARPWIIYALENFLIQAKLRGIPEEHKINMQNSFCLLWDMLTTTDISGSNILKRFPDLKEFGLTDKYLNAKVLSFWRQLARTNIAEAYKQCSFTIFTLRGEYDATSHVQDQESILSAAKEAGLEAKAHTIPGIDHFCNAGSSMVDCFTRLLQGKVSYQPERLLKALTEWLLEGNQS